MMAIFGTMPWVWHAVYHTLTLKCYFMFLDILGQNKHFWKIFFWECNMPFITLLTLFKIFTKFVSFLLLFQFPKMSCSEYSQGCHHVVMRHTKVIQMTRTGNSSLSKVAQMADKGNSPLTKVTQHLTNVARPFSLLFPFWSYLHQTPVTFVKCKLPLSVFWVTFTWLKPHVWVTFVALQNFVPKKHWTAAGNSCR